MRQRSSWLRGWFLTVGNNASQAKNIIGQPYGNASQKYSHRHQQCAVQDFLTHRQCLCKTRHLWLFFCIYGIPWELSEQMLVCHCPVTETLVFFVAHICERNFLISFIFKKTLLYQFLNVGSRIQVRHCTESLKSGSLTVVPPPGRGDQKSAGEVCEYGALGSGRQ